MPPSPPPAWQPRHPQQGGAAILDGVLERVTFSNPETGYTIARSRRTVALAATLGRHHRR